MQAAGFQRVSVQVETHRTLVPMLAYCRHRLEDADVKERMGASVRRMMRWFIEVNQRLGSRRLVPEYVVVVAQ